MIIFVFIPFILSQFNYFNSVKISSKPAKVEISGFKHMLCVAEVSDSINSFPPHLVIYSIGQSRVGAIQTITGPCYSLGTQISTFRFGFYATAPASAFRWGEPGPLLYRIIPPVFTMQRLSDFPQIPYGESFATSNKGNLQILCSPFSSSDCIILTENNITKLHSPSSSIDLFGHGVAVSKNGSIIITISRDIESGNAIVNFFSNTSSKITSFTVPHSPAITSRTKQPIIQFLNERQVGIVFPEIHKFIIYKYSSFDGWSVMKELETPIESFTQIDQNIISVTSEGTVIFYDRLSYITREEIIVPKQIQKNGKFTKITSGKDWFAILEESPDQRVIHVYTSRHSPLLRGIAIFVIISLITIIGIVLKENINVNKVMKKINRKRNQYKYSFKSI